MSPLIVIVSGANRGIGKAICQGVLALPRPVILYAASRAGHDLGFPVARGSEVNYPRLDITDRESVQRLVQRVAGEQGGVDALINNAGVNVDARYSLDSVEQTLATNYRGTLRMNEYFLPLVRAHQGRIVNLSSVGSMLNPYSEAIRARFRAVESLEQVDELAREYISHVRGRTETTSGWGGPRRAYSVSKALINGFTRVLARREEARGTGVVVNCCCPGWVDTEMGKLIGKPTKSPEDGARIPLRLAFGDVHGTSGEYWANASVADTEEGSVQPW